MPLSRAHGRYESLDHWRGLACLLVVIYHATIVQVSSRDWRGDRGLAHWLVAQTHTFNVGVALFFVISGYCIAAASASAARKNGGGLEFFVRRFRRIYPPFWIVVVASLGFYALADVPFHHLLSAYPWMQPPPWWYSPSQWFGNLTLTETWRWHVFGGPRAHFPGQAWTLCYEEQFYLVMGLLVTFLPSALFAGVTAVTAVTLALMLTGVGGVDGFFFDGSWLLFAAGVAVYYRVTAAPSWRRRAVDLALLVSMPIGWLVAVPVSGGVIGFAFAGALVVLHRFDRVLASARWLRPLHTLGQMCYSLYLVHQLPVKAVSQAAHRAGLTGSWGTLLVTVPLSLLVALPLGWLCHVAVERRFLNPSHEAPARVRASSLSLASAQGL